MAYRSEQLRKKERMEITLPTLTEYYIASKKLKNCSRKTLTATHSNLGKFTRFLTGRGHSLKLADLTLQHARDYVSYLQGTVTKYEQSTRHIPAPNHTYTPQTVHTHVRHLRSFSNWLAQEGYTKTPLFERLELPKLPQTKIDVLNVEEIKQVLGVISRDTALGARLHAMVVLMLDTGIRVGELTSLKLADVDWQRGVFKVFGKGAKERLVPIGTSAKQSLLRYVQVYRPKPARMDIDCAFLSVDGYPLTVDSVVHIVQRLAKRSGVTRLHAHLLRHTSGVQYLMLGGDTKSLQMFLGHASPFMTHHYEQLKDEHMIAQHRKFSPVDALDTTPRRFGRPKKDAASGGA